MLLKEFCFTILLFIFKLSSLQAIAVHLTLAEPIIVNSCSFVKCSSGHVCIISTGCQNCNPMCFPDNNITFKAAVLITCQNITCPTGFACEKDFDKKLICVKKQIEATVSSLTNTSETQTTYLINNTSLPLSTRVTTNSVSLSLAASTVYMRSVAHLEAELSQTTRNQSLAKTEQLLMSLESFKQSFLKLLSSVKDLYSQNDKNS